jgi:3-hydroxy acid dehydrogenase/malonic semialdehyde reductase
MYPRHTPKVVFISGATGDFGSAMARRFADLGCALILHGRTADKLEKLASALRDENKASCHISLFDMTKMDSMEAAIKTLPPAFQPIDVLVNNAGGALGLEPAHKADLADWDTMIDVNIKGLVHLTRLILPGMAARKTGHVINIGSTAGTYPYPGGNVYGAAKAFVKQFSLNLRADLAGTGVRVTNIEPGMAETQFSLVRFKGDQAKADAVYAKTHPLQAEDVAESVLWAATLPPHVNVNRIELMPTTQSFGPFAIERFD